jgi:hypothetical protein
MKVNEYLLQHEGINLSWIATKMYPNQKNPRTFLNRKLREHAPAKWLPSDSEKALEVLKNLAIDINKLEP